MAETKTEARTFAPGDHVTWSQISGVAFYVDGPETEQRYPDPEWIADDAGDEDPDTGERGYWWEPDEDDAEPVETGRLIIVMVGDDRPWYTDPDELTPLDEDDYCGGCGQIGCGWS